MLLLDLKNPGQLPSIPGFAEAVKYLQSLSGDEEDGTVELDGKNVYALIQSYETRQEVDAPPFEAHREYIDIQALFSGRELMGWASLDAVTVTKPYDSEKDILFGTVPEENRAFTSFAPGQLIVLFPSDAHAPGLTEGAPKRVKKVVMKIKKSQS